MSIDEGFQPGPAPVRTSAPRQQDEEPPPHPTPRSPFPLTGALIVALGLLFLLLVLSAGFNVSFILNPNGGFRMRDRQLAEQEAIRQKMQAEQAAAQVQLEQAQRQEAELRRRFEEVRRELERTKEQLDEAKRARPNKADNDK
jgi:uncharacterized protein HemX